jgi:hypothetical protein
MAYCETYDDGSWYCSYDDGSEQVGYADGSTNYSIPGSAPFDWNALAQSGVAAAATVLSRNGYNVQRPAPSATYNGQIPGVAASAGVNRAGVGGSLNISMNTLLIIGVVVFAFVFGKGRR